MKKLTYWIADCLTDESAYSIRAATRRECMAQRQKRGVASYGLPRKVVVQYRDTLHLLDKCLGEDPGGFESNGRPV